MKVTLVSNFEVDLDNVPENFEELVQKRFAKYTEGTRREYMYHDKLCFLDVVVRRLHGDRWGDDAVMDLMEQCFSYELRERGNVPEKEDFFDISFMETCFNEGKRSMEMYSHEWLKDQRKHDDDKIMKILCRVTKAVMDYEWGNDGL